MISRIMRILDIISTQTICDSKHLSLYGSRYYRKIRLRIQYQEQLLPRSMHYRSLNASQRPNSAEIRRILRTALIKVTRGFCGPHLRRDNHCSKNSPLKDYFNLILNLINVFE